MKKSAVILCAVLGSLGGVILTLIASFGLFFIGFGGGGNDYASMILVALIMLAVCIPTGIMGNKLKRRFGIPAPVYVVFTCAAPLIWSIIERAKHLEAVANDGYNYFMGGLAYGLNDVFSRIWLIAAIAFLVGQCAAVLKYKFNT